jgi:signal transduction histidine kinase/ActR/RegA family two-component response regulator
MNIPNMDVYLIDKEMKYIVAQGSEMKKYQLTPKDFIGKKVSEIGFDKKTTEFLNENYKKVLSGEIITKEYVYQGIDYEFRGAPVEDEEGNIIAALWISINQSKQKDLIKEIEKRKNEYKELYNENRTINAELEEKLEELQKVNEALDETKKKAVENDRLKSAFLANMSHEIRTPMNGIIGFSELLKASDKDDPKINDYIDKVSDSSEQLLDIISDILDISKIETKQYEIFEESFNLNGLLEEFYLAKSYLQKKEKVSFSINCGASDSESFIITDRSKLHKILKNLLDNAFKFTEEGKVELGYSFEGNMINFYVKDTGIGIPRDKKALVFQHFVQADTSETRKYGGTGLGLSIAKGLTEMLGGNIGVKETGQEGSVLSFAIPYKTNENQDYEKRIEGEGENGERRKKTVMIVEDDETNLMYIQELLKDKELSNHFEIEQLLARSGKEAYDLYKKNPGLDLILMDLKLPDIGGLEITKEIRKQDTGISVIAQTAYAMSGDKRKAIEAGCNDYITKPIERKEFISKVQIFLG